MLASETYSLWTNFAWHIAFLPQLSWGYLWIKLSLQCSKFSDYTLDMQIFYMLWFIHWKQANIKILHTAVIQRWLHMWKLRYTSVFPHPISIIQKYKLKTFSNILKQMIKVLIFLSIYLFLQVNHCILFNTPQQILLCIKYILEAFV